MPQVKSSRMAPMNAEAGIAIGPILFIIAILAILAAAIAAGSGSFTASTTTEGDRTKAAAMIQIGENLKIGTDRLIMGNSIDFASIVIDPTKTENNNELFAPAGGGISAPSDSLAATPGTDHWKYPQAAMPGFGTAAVEQVAMLAVSQGVCTEVNSRANAIATPAGADLGDMTGTTPTITVGSWPAALDGKPTGCVNNTNATTPGYYFYQILAIQ